MVDDPIPSAMPEALRSSRPAIEALCGSLGVRRLELFGSAADGRFDSARSDYDFLVELDPEAGGSRAQRLISLAEGLEALLGRPVDLVNPKYVRNPYMMREVERTRRPIYG